MIWVQTLRLWLLFLLVCSTSQSVEQEIIGDGRGR